MNNQTLLIFSGTWKKNSNYLLSFSLTIAIKSEHIKTPLRSSIRKFCMKTIAQTLKFLLIQEQQIWKIRVGVRCKTIRDSKKTFCTITLKI
jgi:hypothetical protein